MNWIVRNFIISSLLATGVFSFIFFSETGELPDIHKHWEGYLLTIFFANLGSVILYRVNNQLNISIPWNKKRTVRFIVEPMVGLVVFALLGLLFYYIYISPGINQEQEGDFWANYRDGIVKFGIILFVLIYLISLVNFSMFSYNQYTVVQIEKLSHERNQLNLQFEALKSQLNPHFLFNALNTISSLAYREVSMAEDFIRDLADTYRYILKTESKKLVNLSEEIEMVKAFFNMQLIKFEDCIRFEILVPEALMETKIPPLTLQMLLENALKHNLICEDMQLNITLSATEKHLLMKNNIIEKPKLLRLGNDVFDRPKEDHSHKIGLGNIKNRYRYFGNEEVEIERNDFFTVKLPILK